MSHVIGIPLIKGKSDAIRTCSVDAGANGDYPLLEGMAGFWKTGEKRGIEPVLVRADNPDSSGGFAGFVLDINPGSKKASWLYKAALVALPITEGDNWTPGERVTIDLGTSYISKSGTTTNVDAYIDQVGVTGVNGKDGSKKPCVLVQILSNKQDYPEPATATPTATAKK